MQSQCSNLAENIGIYLQLKYVKPTEVKWFSKGALVSGRFGPMTQISWAHILFVHGETEQLGYRGIHIFPFINVLTMKLFFILPEFLLLYLDGQKILLQTVLN